MSRPFTPEPPQEAADDVSREPPRPRQPPWKGRRLLAPTVNRMKTLVRVSPFMPAYPLHRLEPIRPVFIVGSGRSGTTLMRRILVESGQIHIPPEVHVLHGVITSFKGLNGLHWDTLVRLILGQFEYAPGFEHFGVTLRPLATELMATPPSQRSLARVIDRIYRYHAEQTNPGPTRWGDKTPLNAYHMDLIRSVFPSIRYLHMLRDGCDVVASCLEIGRYPTAREAGERWIRATRDAERFRASHPGACLEVRYEELVTDPEVVVKRVCAFADVDFSERMLESTEHLVAQRDVSSLSHLRRALAPISVDRIGVGRRVLDRETREELQALIGRDLARLGYPPCA
jgi:protein-tyrosine sulfotransferase